MKRADTRYTTPHNCEICKKPFPALAVKSMADADNLLIFCVCGPCERDRAVPAVVFQYEPPPYPSRLDLLRRRYGR